MDAFCSEVFVKKYSLPITVSLQLLEKNGKSFSFRKGDFLGAGGGTGIRISIL